MLYPRIGERREIDIVAENMLRGLELL